ncbi:unnamed protein product, partial [Mesorhabditis belari]|uniref:Gamma-glutamylcyclotransferase n=1 Tax=Mesorhabditis belari TaxID=2138241 RepID=A0AAF3JAP6_9BILA
MLFRLSRAMLTQNEIESSLWVFGYGSLIWNPGFLFEEKRRGYALGFARRMYQGNTYHRGDDLLPGRVATLINDASSSASGMLFRVEGQKQIRAALEHLTEREVGNGYEFRVVACEVEMDNEIVQMNALTCIAHHNNEFYLGPDETFKMADEIRRAKGLAGPNYEYVLKLAEHIRLLFPEENDRHLFELEGMVRNGLATLA